MIPLLDLNWAHATLHAELMTGMGPPVAEDVAQSLGASIREDHPFRFLLWISGQSI